MFYRIILICSFVLSAFAVMAQDWRVASGPIRGHWSDTLRTYWLLLQQTNNHKLPVFSGNEVSVAGTEHTGITTDTIALNKKHKILRYYFRGNYATPPKDSFSFLAGSCAFPFPILLWSGAKREPIFDVMREKSGDFMIWMGDNVYYLFGQHTHRSSMARVNIRYRKKARIQALLENQPNYAAWDDHDYGGNNSGFENKYRDLALQMFKDVWMNPSYGQPDNNGIYTRWTWQNAEFFMLDPRYHCNEKEEAMFGKQQMEWLKKGLLESKADFKFIIAPTQALTDNPVGEDWGAYPAEKKAFLEFLEKEPIEGVLFISGDLHYAEWNILQRPGTYPLYEFTTSPMTSFINPTWNRNNPLREEGTLVLEQNFGKITVLKDRCRFDLRDKEGAILWSKEVLLADLKKK